MSVSLDTRLTRTLGLRLPIVGGAMYPCSNPELVSAVSAAGGIGVVQPMALAFVWKQDVRAGLRAIRAAAGGPIGINLILEKSSRLYERRIREWGEIALEEGVRFVVTALGNPRWVVEAAHQVGAVVYHDVTERKWAEKALDGGVDGLIAVNRRAGGHAGRKSAEELIDELAPLGRPLVCAGGVGDAPDFVRALALGYDGVQLGTRLIASSECRVHDAYKQAILAAEEDDIVLTERLTGVPLAVIRTPAVERLGLHAGPFARWMLRGRKTKHWMRLFYSLASVWTLRRDSLRGQSTKDVFQAGKSVGAIQAVEPVTTIFERFRRAAAAD